MNISHLLGNFSNHLSLLYLGLPFPLFTALGWGIFPFVFLMLFLSYPLSIYTYSFFLLWHVKCILILVERMVQMTKYDVLWFYQGGTDCGRWQAALVEPKIFDQTENALHHMGYFTVRSRRAIGPPEGPPAEMLEGLSFPVIDDRDQT
jgi:hypothetical protein